MNSKSTRIWRIVAGTPFVCAIMAALLAAPSQHLQSVDVDFSASAPLGESADVSNAVDLVVASLAKEAPAATAKGAVDAVATSAKGTRIDVSGVVMVLNADGSATLSATFKGRGKGMALKAVHMESEAGVLDVASTQMWLPILPGVESRAGDASDAGGFVVPRGLTPGLLVHLQLQFDNDTCLEIDARTVRRNAAYDEVYPTTGQKLGPGKRIVAQVACARA